MNIKGVGSPNGVGYYNKVAQNRVQKTEGVKTSDRIEISNAAKALKGYEIETSSYDKTAKVEEIKNRIASGTYNIDAKLTAKSMLDAMKGIK
ncbi:MAG: flagellar biosynthesis anti-sigma factor FlgM [Clostridium sp.]